MEIQIKRKCYDCKKELQLIDFHKHSKEKYGRAYECKSCKRKRDKEYNKRNRIKVLKQKREYDTKKSLLNAIEIGNVNIIERASNRLLMILTN